MSVSLRESWLSSLYTRSILQLIGVGVVLGALISGYAIVQQQRAVLSEMEQRGALLGESLGSACSLPYFLGDAKTVRYLLSKAAAIQDILAIDVVNPQGHVDFEAADKGVPGWPEGQKPDAGQLKVWNSPDSIHVLAPLMIERQESNVEQMLAPGPSDSGQVKSSVLGYLYIRLSPARARKLARDFIRSSTLVTVVAIVLASVVAFFLQRKTVLNPIRRLVVAMAAMREGHMDMIPESGGAREIGVMIHAFNEMALALRSAEQELKKANAELEQRVLDRTKDLAKANEELQESQERVVRSEKLAAIGQLASGVGHELRNPLAAISNAVYYLRDAIKGSALATEDPTLVEFLDLADREIKGATNIIRDLLDFSRVSKISPQPTDINGVVLEAKSMIEMPPTVKVIEDLGKDMPQAMIDREKMRQVFMNLIQNAAQAMPKGGEIHLASRVESSPEAGGQAFVVEVRDTGSGIKDEDLKKIFEPLFTTKAKGTGLGLPISLGIVQKHGGGIKVVSKLGEGTTFTVRVPVGGAKNAA